MYVDWILGTRKRTEKERNIFSLFWLTQGFWFWKYHFEWVMLVTLLYAVFPRKDIHTYNSKIVFTQFFLQNIKNKQIRTTKNPPVTPHGLWGNVQTLTFSTLHMLLLLLTFFNNSFNYSFNYSAFPNTYSLGWHRIAPCSQTQIFLYLYTVFCIRPTGCSTEISCYGA